MADKSEQSPLDIKWIIIGFGVMFGLSWLLTALAFDPWVLELLTPLLEALGPTWGGILLIVSVLFGAFFGGGLLVAYFSPGHTIKEPAISATLAIVANLIYANTREGADPKVLSIVIALGAAYVSALLGAKLGERLQGDTTDKMRDSGNLLR